MVPDISVWCWGDWGRKRSWAGVAEGQECSSFGRALQCCGTWAACPLAARCGVMDGDSRCYRSGSKCTSWGFLSFFPFFIWFSGGGMSLGGKGQLL